MHKQIMSEYLGEIDARTLLETLNRTYFRDSPVPKMLYLLQAPLVVNLEIEYTWAEGTDPYGDPPVIKRFARITANPDLLLEATLDVA